MSSLTERELTNLYAELVSKDLGNTKAEIVQKTLEELHRAGCLQPKAIAWNLKFTEPRRHPVKRTEPRRDGPAPKAPKKVALGPDLYVAVVSTSILSVKLEHANRIMKVTRNGAAPPADTKDLLVVSDDLGKAERYLSYIQRDDPILLYNTMMNEEPDRRLFVASTEFGINDRLKSLFP